ncbi:MAG: RNA polymerase sigma factor [candidate division Zixibacteria bacterium]
MSERFWKLLEPEYIRAMMFCRKLMGDRDAGNDLYQDALVNALKGFSTLNEQSSFRPWLYKIIVNTFHSLNRRPWWKRMIPITAEIENIPTGTSQLEILTAKRWLRELFKVLSKEQQALITLHELEGWPIRELAELNGKSEGAIKAKLFRARNKMKNALMNAEKKTARKSMNLSATDKPELAALKPD